MRRPLTPSTIANTLSSLLVFGVAYHHALRSEEPICDVFIVRSLRPSFGIFHRLEVIVASITNYFPTLPRAHAASVATAIFVSLSAYIVVVAIENALTTIDDRSRWASPVAIVASLGALLSAPWQVESSIPGGEAIAAALAALPVLLYAGSPPSSRRDFALGTLLGLAVCEDPRVACVSLLALVAVRFAAPADAARTALSIRPLVAGAAVGLVPLGAHLAFGPPNLRRLTEGFLPSTALPLGTALSLVWNSGGAVLAPLGVVGAFFGLRTKGAAPLTVGLLALTLGGAVLGAREGGVHPLSWGPGTLLFVLGVGLLATFALFAAVRALARSQARFSGMTTAMVFLLEVAIVVQHVEVGADVCEGRDGPESESWHRELFAGLPQRSVLIVTTRTTWLALEAARLSGGLGDRLLLPTFAQAAGVADQDLRADAPLRALVRELELGSPPSEWALSSLADTRPVFVEWTPTWDRAIEKHLTLERLLPEYHSAPRGTAELHKSIEEWRGRAEAVVHADGWEARVTDRWVRSGGLPTTSATDRLQASEMRRIVLHLLRVQGGILATLGDSAELATAVTFVRSELGGDPWLEELLARLARTKGGKALDVRSLPDVE